MKSRPDKKHFEELWNCYLQTLAVDALSRTLGWQVITSDVSSRRNKPL